MRQQPIHDFGDWRATARRLLSAGVSPDAVQFIDAADALQSLLFADEAIAPVPPSQAFRVPKAFVEMAQKVACHRDVDRYDLLYRALWRIAHREPRLLDLATDDAVHRLSLMEK